MGITDERAKEIGDILKPIFEEADKKGVFNGVEAIIRIEASGKIKTQEEWYLVFFRMGLYLGGMFEREAAAKRAIEAMKQLGEVVKIEQVKHSPRKRVIN